jgi:hypothetical protein
MPTSMDGCKVRMQILTVDHSGCHVHCPLKTVFEDSKKSWRIVAADGDKLVLSQTNSPYFTSGSQMSLTYFSNPSLISEYVFHNLEPIVV